MHQAVDPAVQMAVDEVVHSLMRSLRTLKRATAGAAVDGPCLGVLHSVAQSGPVRPSDLAAEVGLDASTVSRHLQALERLSLIARDRDPVDGRAFRVAATSEGTAAVDAATAARRHVLVQALEGWDADDLTTLAALVTRLADDLSATTPGDPS